tara:strand:- start:422 stop:1018 length:597 start_codon:yes stop_codon:yes gene_type:complete
MKRNKFYILSLSALLTIGLIACEEKKQQTDNEADTFQEKNAKNFSKQVNLPNKREVKLVSDATNASANWMAFTTAKNEIERINNFTLQEVVNNSNNLFRSIQELQDSIPKQFQEIPIKARLNVLLTKAHLLEAEANKQRPTAGKIDTLSFELYNEFENLKIQLNEVFLKSVDDLDFELDERIRKQDSLAQLQKESTTK